MAKKLISIHDINRALKAAKTALKPVEEIVNAAFPQINEAIQREGIRAAQKFVAGLGSNEFKILALAVAERADRDASQQ